MTPDLQKARDFFDLGIKASNSGDCLAALDLFNEALRLAPARPSILNNTAALLVRLERFGEAIPLLQRALCLEPGNPHSKNNLALALSSAGDFQAGLDEALDCTRVAPGYAPGWNTLANSYERFMCWDAAEEAYGKALTIDPSFAEAQHNLATLELLRGKFSRGWPRYEWRWRNPQNKSARLAVSSEEGWNGKDEIAFWPEHGIGDQLIYCTALRLLKRSLQIDPSKVFVFCANKLAPLLNAGGAGIQIRPVTGFEDFVARHPRIHTVSLASLRHFLAVYADVPFDRLDKPRRFAGQFTELTISDKAIDRTSIKIGISWRSTSKSRGRGKSASVDDFCFLATLSPCVTLVNLQFDASPEELALVEKLTGRKIVDSPDIDKFDDLLGLSRLIQTCDFVVTVSNTVAHVAGSIGARTMVLVPDGANRLWYWHETLGPSIWYENLRTIRVSAGAWICSLEEAFKHGVESRDA